LKAPSAVMRRKKFGRRSATKNASATGPAPIIAAAMISRTRPKAREAKVRPLTVATARRKDIQNPYKRDRASLGPALPSIKIPGRVYHWRKLVGEQAHLHAGLTGVIARVAQRLIIPMETIDAETHH